MIRVVSDVSVPSIQKKTDVMRFIASQIRNLLHHQGFTQAELAKRVGIPPSHLNNFLKGHSDIRSGLLLKVLAELGIELNSLIQYKTEAIHAKTDLGNLNRLETQIRCLNPQDRRVITSLIQKMSQKTGALDAN